MSYNGVNSIQVLFGNHCTGEWVSHICLSLCEAMCSHGAKLKMWVRSTSDAGRRRFVREPVPRLMQRGLYRLKQGDRLARYLERRYLDALRPGDIAWVWPNASVPLLEQIRNRGNVLVLEYINCHEKASKAILDEAYRRLGADESPIGLERARQACQVAGLADYSFSPSPCVSRTLLEAGVDPQTILESSYGWQRSRLAGTGCLLPPAPGLTALFVGSVCVRKGVHLLLEAWARSGVRGRLLLAGRVEPLIAQVCAGLLAREDVVLLGHISDVGAVYRSADVFVFPSLEEGSPLVSYEAMACGLPSILSPMAAGGVARDGLEAVVREPYDIDGWAAALRRLSEDIPLREDMSVRARRRADEFTWNEVGMRRLAQLRSLQVRRLGGATLSR